MRALIALPLLAACAPTLPPQALSPDAAPIQVSHAAYSPAPQPLPADALAALPADVATGDVFIAPDGCWFFLQGEQLMLLTTGSGTTQAPYCP